MSVFFQENVSTKAPSGGIEDQRCDTQDSYQRDRLRVFIYREYGGERRTDSFGLNVERPDPSPAKTL